MQQLQEIFARMQAAKKKQKDLRASYKDALETSLEYKEVGEKLSTLKEKKKSIENTIRAQFANELQQLEDLAVDLQSDKELLTDMAVTTLMKGETVEVKDEYENTYHPVFAVSFKKTT